MSHAKQMARDMTSAAELWKLEAYLAKHRKAIDNKYDYRYSVLPLVFGGLIREGYLSEAELQGLVRR